MAKAGLIFNFVVEQTLVEVVGGGMENTEQGSEGVRESPGGSFGRNRSTMGETAVELNLNNGYFRRVKRYGIIHLCSQALLLSIQT